MESSDLENISEELPQKHRFKLREAKKSPRQHFYAKQGDTKQASTHTCNHSDQPFLWFYHVSIFNFRLLVLLLF